MLDRRDQIRDEAIRLMENMPAMQLLLAPLEFILADHFRQRTLCNLLSEMSEEVTVDDRKVRAVLRYLTRDFGIHILDEEEDLFPLLRRRAHPEDRLEDVLDKLSAEHTADQREAEAIVSGLEEMKDGVADLPEDFRKRLDDFARSEKRHLVVENAIAIPLARTRLCEDDMRNLGRRMAARRGIVYPGNGHAV